MILICGVAALVILALITQAGVVALQRTYPAQGKIIDPTAANPDTVMPPFGQHRILDAAEIERLVEFLHALP